MQKKKTKKIPKLILAKDYSGDYCQFTPCAKIQCQNGAQCRYQEKVDKLCLKYNM